MEDLYLSDLSGIKIICLFPKNLSFTFIMNEDFTPTAIRLFCLICVWASSPVSHTPRPTSQVNLVKLSLGVNNCKVKSFYLLPPPKILLAKLRWVFLSAFLYVIMPFDMWTLCFFGTHCINLCDNEDNVINTQKSPIQRQLNLYGFVVVWANTYYSKLKTGSRKYSDRVWQRCKCKICLFSIEKVQDSSRSLIGSWKLEFPTVK